MSGTSTFDTTLSPLDISGVGALTQFGATNADFDVIVNNSGSPFLRVDLHGTYGSPCTFWWMAIPSS
jgi:hypothetical protein